MSSFIGDLTGLVSVNGYNAVREATHSTNKKAGTDLDMSDFMQLMVASITNQSMDDSMSTSEMMNQMVQMSLVQAITNINALVSETSGLSYAASLVGKEVTIGQYAGDQLNQIIGTVTGSGMVNGSYVVFIGDQSYALSDVLSVGRLPSTVQTGGTQTIIPNSQSQNENQAESAPDPTAGGLGTQESTQAPQSQAGSSGSYTGAYRSAAQNAEPLDESGITLFYGKDANGEFIVPESGAAVPTAEPEASEG